MQHSWHRCSACRKTVWPVQMLREHPEYGIAAISEDAGFNSVRTFQRKCNEAVGMSPVEFRMLVDQAKKQL